MAVIYTFDIIGIAPLLTFFEHQQKVEQTPYRSRAYLGSFQCTLDGFVLAVDRIWQKPAWDWDGVLETMVAFWLSQGEAIAQWQAHLAQAEDQSLIVARVANVELMRRELETFF